jgi:hypothetical protein
MQNELAGIRKVLEKIKEMQRPERGTKPFPAATKLETRTTPNEEDTIIPYYR